jgi:hypothetical protein
MEQVLLRRATASDAQAIGAVFDAAVRDPRVIAPRLPVS